MITPDLSIEYSYIKLPYDLSVKSTSNFHSFRLQIVAKKCRKGSQLSSELHHSS